MKKHSVIKDIVLEALAEFPKAHTKTLAELLYNRNRAVFKTVEQARTSLRYYRGNQGEKSRKTVRPTNRPNAIAGTSFPELPEGFTSFEDWGALIIPGPTKALILSDIHVPYHDRRSIEASVEFGKDADLVILNGDSWDCYEVSSFQPDPRKCDFNRAREMTIELLEWLRAKFPKARIIYKEGNHEERLERYFTVRAPAVLGCEEFQLRNLLKLDDLGIEWLGEKRPIRVGKLYVIHGHEFRGGFTNPVNPARGLFLRAKVHALQGHNHQSSQHSETALSGKVISTWSTGCLCDLHPEYMPINNWSNGAATVQIDSKGAFQVKNFRIIDGVVYS